MTKRKIQSIFYLIIGICILVIVLSFTMFDFIEVDTATNWTMKYFALPILLFMTPSCYFIYIRFIQQYERKKYTSNIRTQFRTIFRILVLTLGMTGIFIASTLSIIILTNSVMGDGRIINLNATVVNYYTSSSGKIKHYIKIKDKQLDRIIELKVKESYKVGETFVKTMKIGKWGLIYSEK